MRLSVLLHDSNHCHLYFIRSQFLISREWHMYYSKFNWSFNWIQKSNNFIISIAPSSYPFPECFVPLNNFVFFRTTHDPPRSICSTFLRIHDYFHIRHIREDSIGLATRAMHQQPPDNSQDNRISFK